jgi:transcription elongation factor SPT6
MQGELSKKELMKRFNLEFVNRTNEVGVDINRAIIHPRTAHILQFVCGLGPRKGDALIQTLKHNKQRLENRTQFVTACHMGPKVNLLHGYNFVKTIF